MEYEFNKLTGKYEVFMFGAVHEFDSEAESQGYIDNVMTDYFSDPF